MMPGLLSLAELSHWCLHITGCLATYWIHSTLVIAVVWLLELCRPRLHAGLRRVLWITALGLPLLTSVCTSIRPDAAWGPRLLLTADFETSGSIASVSSRPPADFRVQTETGQPQVAGQRTQTWQSTMAPWTAVNRLSSHAAQATADGISLIELPTTRLWTLLTAVWLLTCGLSVLRIGRHFRQLRQLQQRCRPVRSGTLHAAWLQLQQRCSVSPSVKLLVSDMAGGPLTCGILQPCVIIPRDFLQRLTTAQRNAMLAHELAHVLQRDCLWNLLSLSIRNCFCFQPLNWLARRRLKLASEFLADQTAAQLCEQRVPMASCLTELADWLLQQTPRTAADPALAVGMGTRQSILSQRITRLLEDSAAHQPAGRSQRWGTVALLLAMPCSLLLFSPRVVAQRSPGDSPTVHSSTSDSANEGTAPVKNTLSALTIAAGLAVPQTLPAAALPAAGPASAVVATSLTPQDSATAPQQAAETTAVPVPEELRGFSGMLIGKMVSRDIERGSFTVTVNYVARIWENNKAENPRVAVGRTLTVQGISGKWLDALLLIRPGETMEFEAQHRGGEQLTFPGEWLKKAPPFDPAAHPLPPEEFRGFAGIVTGRIESRAEESGELLLRVATIEKSFDRSTAKNAAAIIGKPVLIAGFWGKLRPPFDELHIGDQIRIGLLHRVRQSDHFSVAEVVEKLHATDAVDRPEKAGKPDQPAPAAQSAAHGFPEGLRGFRGILSGTVVSRDAERGELQFRVTSVKRVWKENKAKNAESSAGHTLMVRGISGRFLDVLLVLKAGDAVEVEAFHNAGNHLDFSNEWLKQAE